MNQFYIWLWSTFDDRWLAAPAFLYVGLVVGICLWDSRK